MNTTQLSPEIGWLFFTQTEKRKSGNC